MGAERSLVLGRSSRSFWFFERRIITLRIDSATIVNYPRELPAIFNVRVTFARVETHFSKGLETAFCARSILEADVTRESSGSSSRFRRVAGEENNFSWEKTWSIPRLRRVIWLYRAISFWRRCDVDDIVLHITMCRRKWEMHDFDFQVTLWINLKFRTVRGF